jgi:hypothetical protein
VSATQQGRVFVGAMLAGLSMFVVACGHNPSRNDAAHIKYPTRADFKIRYTADKVIITPNSGYAMVHLSRTPNRNVDNRLVWVSSTDQFEIEFKNQVDPAQPPPAPFPTGWQPASSADRGWAFVIDLDQGEGVPEIRAVKYSVRHISGKPEEDPVIIVRN